MVLVRENKSGWFVWTKHGNRPHFVHESYEAAQIEAMRLATLHPGWRFIIMEAKSKIHMEA